MLRKVEPHDLVKFGLIPELIGRLPVITVLDDLDEDALVRVLKEPRNSLVKQYKELLGMDNVSLPSRTKLCTPLPARPSSARPVPVVCAA
mgnify:CR=1 FL=1